MKLTIFDILNPFVILQIKTFCSTVAAAEKSEKRPTYFCIPCLERELKIRATLNHYPVRRQSYTISIFW